MNFTFKTISLIFGILIFSFNVVFAYEVDTHAYLTDEIIDFYNKNFSENKISDELTPYLIDGSRREDDVPRWMNHFYDPVNNRGLSYDAAIDPAINLGTWEKSKNWANNENNQNKLTYKVPATIASILSAFEQKKLSDVSSETDFTWKKAIEYWIKGEKEKAMFALGHILHLIEDASVPDHTRNDPHPNDSSYEKWTSKFILENPDDNLAERLRNKKPFVLDDLNSYFDGLATYSNNNFYSKDTIGIQSGYKLPESQYTQQIGDYIYGFHKDEDGDFKLFIKEKNSLFNDISPLGENIKIFINKDGGDIVIKDYWSRLSVKAVQYGAGAIDLFFKEVEKAKNDPNFIKIEPKSFFAEIKETAQSVVSDIIYTVKDFIGTEKNPAENLAATVYLDKKENIADNQVAPFSQIVETGNLQPILQNIAAVNADNQDEDLVEANAKKSAAVNVVNTTYQPAPISVSGNGAMVSAPILSAQPSSNFRQCSFKTDKSPTRNNLIINEVAWMGGPVSANDEWFELKNISGKELDLTNWQILDKDEQVKIAFKNGTKLTVEGFLLLERTDDNSIPGLKADLIYVGALSNSDEGLRLFDNNCDLADEVLASPDWLAGISDLRKTMERGADLTWHTYSGNGENFGGIIIMGTPKKENSQPATTTVVQNNSQQEKSNEPALPEPPPAPSNNHIVISEVQITGGSGQTTNDFIELYNPTDAAFNLKGHRLVKQTKTGTSDTSIKSWTSDEFIPAKGFYLWANSGYTGIAVIPDATTTAAIADDNGIALRQGDEDTGTIIDSVAWGEAQNAFVESANAALANANQSIERKALQNNNCISASGNGEFLGNNCDTNNNQDNFELRALPKPQNSQSFPEPRSAPITISNFNANYSSSTLELVLTWGESADYSNGTSTLEYLISYSTSSPAEFKELAALPATTTYNFRVKEVGLTESFSILIKDKEGLASAAASTSIVIPSIFQAIYFYPDPRPISYYPYMGPQSTSTIALELRYDTYPFIANPYYKEGPSWRIATFYKNKDALAVPEFYSDQQYYDLPDGVSPKQYGEWGSMNPEALKIRYWRCSSSELVESTALVFPDSSSNCSPWRDGLANASLSWSKLGESLEKDKNLIVLLSDNQERLKEGDYLTVAFYAYSSRYSEPLLVVDRQKYYFQNNSPAHQRPILNNPLASLEFNRKKSDIEINWQKATDSDSLDFFLTYEINYSTTTQLEDGNWTSNFDQSSYGDNGLITRKRVAPGDKLLIGLRAKDDFGNYSEVATTTWTWPETSWQIIQDQRDWWTGFGNIACARCPYYASLQRLSLEEELQFNVVSLRLKVEWANQPSEISLAVYPDDGGFPDFGSKIAEANLKNFVVEPDSDIAFSFDEVVTLEEGNDYWLVLDTKNGSWQNATAIGSDYYLNGEAGRGPNRDCREDSEGCQLLEVPYPANADWYFKIGLESQ